MSHVVSRAAFRINDLFYTSMNPSISSGPQERVAGWDSIVSTRLRRVFVLEHSVRSIERSEACVEGASEV